MASGAKREVVSGKDRDNLPDIPDPQTLAPELPLGEHSKVLQRPNPGATKTIDGSAGESCLVDRGHVPNKHRVPGGKPPKQPRGVLDGVRLRL